MLKPFFLPHLSPAYYTVFIHHWPPGNSSALPFTTWPGYRQESVKLLQRITSDNWWDRKLLVVNTDTSMWNYYTNCLFSHFQLDILHVTNSQTAILSMNVGFCMWDTTSSAKDKRLLFQVRRPGHFNLGGIDSLTSEVSIRTCQRWISSWQAKMIPDCQSFSRFPWYRQRDETKLQCHATLRLCGAVIGQIQRKNTQCLFQRPNLPNSHPFLRHKKLLSIYKFSTARSNMSIKRGGKHWAIY